MELIDLSPSSVAKTGSPSLMQVEVEFVLLRVNPFVRLSKGIIHIGEVSVHVLLTLTSLPNLFTSNQHVLFCV